MAKVSNHIPFLTGNICSTTDVTIDEDLVNEYSEEVIELAIQLKANNLNGVGGNREDGAKKPLSAADLSSYDTFFVEYAQRMLAQKLSGKIYATFHKMANNCPIKDPQWAGYTADEILAMEKNGVLIPEDVVAWAHGQQQLDITNYVLTLDSDSEDPTQEDTFANTDSLDVLQATAKKNIQKAEKAAEKVEEKKEKYDTIAQKATQIKDKEENNFVQAVKEFKSLTDQWENLKSKKENGKITATEESKFKDLSKLLKNNNIETKLSMNSGKNDLDDFLSELDSLNIEITNTSQIAKDTIYSGRTLNTITKNYNVYTLPYAYTGTSFDNSGLVSMALSGMTNEDIGELAVQKGEELDTSNETTAVESTGIEYAELHAFFVKACRQRNVCLEGDVAVCREVADDRAIIADCRISVFRIARYVVNVLGLHRFPFVGIRRAHDDVRRRALIRVHHLCAEFGLVHVSIREHFVSVYFDVYDVAEVVFVAVDAPHDAHFELKRGERSNFGNVYTLR